MDFETQQVDIIHFKGSDCDLVNVSSNTYATRVRLKPYISAYSLLACKHDKASSCLLF